MTFRRVADDMRDGHQRVRHFVLQEEIVVQHGLRLAWQQQHAIDGRFATFLRQRRHRRRQRHVRIPPGRLQRRVRSVFLRQPAAESSLFAVRIAMELLLPAVAIEPFARVLRTGMVACHRVRIFRVHVFDQRAKMFSGLLPPFQRRHADDRTMVDFVLQPFHRLARILVLPPLWRLKSHARNDFRLRIRHQNLFDDGIHLPPAYLFAFLRPRHRNGRRDEINAGLMGERDLRTEHPAYHIAPQTTDEHRRRGAVAREDEFRLDVCLDPYLYFIDMAVLQIHRLRDRVEMEIRPFAVRRILQRDMERGTAVEAACRVDAERADRIAFIAREIHPVSVELVWRLVEIIRLVENGSVCLVDHFETVKPDIRRLVVKAEMHRQRRVSRLFHRRVELNPLAAWLDDKLLRLRTAEKPTRPHGNAIDLQLRHAVGHPHPHIRRHHAQTADRKQNIHDFHHFFSMDIFYDML